MEDKRPRLDDPKEFKIIRDIYFEKDHINKEQTDPIERLERMEARQRNNNKNSR